jgi:type I restriction enzyme, R subunit
VSIDMSEKGLETLIVRALTGVDGLGVSEHLDPSVTPNVDGLGYFAGTPKNFDRAFSVDVGQLFAFLRLTQADRFAKLGLLDQANPDSAIRKKFLARLSDEVGKRGVIDVLRKGIDHGAVHIDLFYGTPSEGNVKATELYGLNRFSITRQLAYSLDQSRRALDLGLFINGLPIATFELKNRLPVSRASDCSSSAAVLCTSLLMSLKFVCAQSLKEEPRGSCPSTGAITMARATHRTPMVSRRRICGKRFSPRQASPTFWRTMPRS